MDIYVGNLAYATTDDSLRAAFAAYGEVASAEVKKDRMSGRSKGFGFVEMPNVEEANAAIAALNESDLDGRNIRVNESNPQPRGERPPRRGGFGERRGGFGGDRRGGFGDRPRREGGFSRGPRREGGRGFSRGPRRENDTPRESKW
ncbi:MAG: RNA-binding protein [bacterium]|nr:RNA-binding protein [bacterium]